MLKVTDPDMPANPLTEHITTRPIFNTLMQRGDLYFNDPLFYRRTNAMKEFGERYLLGGGQDTMA